MALRQRAGLQYRNANDLSPTWRDEKEERYWWEPGAALMQALRLPDEHARGEDQRRDGGRSKGGSIVSVNAINSAVTFINWLGTTIPLAFACISEIIPVRDIAGLDQRVARAIL